MTSLDVMLKRTDDDASSGFFHLKVSLRHRLKKTSPCLTSPRASAEPLRADALQGLVCLAIPQEKAGMLGHPLFEASVLIKKKPCIHSSDASGKARDEDPDSAVSGRRILAESLPGASGG
ncbi:hypothetical protein [Salisediminibacterium halotolerans]|uniref:hypothetical protein n=1 Tax=Salisediminibacterium halotolerans TaxID=517425 RepID=UPI00115FA96C|nr:hypothetical protein [Salisediminibacterium haloalkalitolerans]